MSQHWLEEGMPRISMCRQNARAMCGEAGFAAILADPRVEAVVLVLPPSVALEVRTSLLQFTHPDGIVLSAACSYPAPHLSYLMFSCM